MSIIELKVDDTILENVLNILKSFPKEKIEITIDDELSVSEKIEKENALNEFKNGKSTNWRDYAKKRGIEINV